MSDATRPKYYRVGVLWRHESNGVAYLTGSAGPLNIAIHPNGYKKKESDPDYTVSIAFSESSLGLREGDEINKKVRKEKI